MSAPTQQPPRPPQQLPTPPSQKPPTVSKIEVTLDVDLMKKLKMKADATNKTPSEVVAELLREYLK